LAPFFCSGAETEFARAQLENPKDNIKTIDIGVCLGITVNRPDTAELTAPNAEVPTASSA